MSMLMDTSAILAVVGTQDRNHAIADEEWTALVGSREEVIVTSYVFLEACALLQNRQGMDAVRTLQDQIRPSVPIAWVTEEVHDSAMAALLSANRRQLSLVDCVSFEVMRRLGITRAFVFNPHFEEQGFEVIPAPTPDAQYSLAGDTQTS